MLGNTAEPAECDEESATEDNVEDEGQTLQDIELAEETDDLELAWENLDMARLILAEQQDTASKLMLADVHLVLGDVSLESENFDQAVLDFEQAVQIKNSMLDASHRERAEAHYKLALALEYTEQLEMAIDNVNLSSSVLQSRLDDLAKVDDKSESVVSEITEIEALFPEMDAKVR